MSQGIISYPILLFLLLISRSQCDDIPEWCSARQPELFEWIKNWTNSNPIPEKELNTAWLNLKNEGSSNLKLYSITDECEKCPHAFAGTIFSQLVTTQTFNSYYGQKLEVRFRDDISKCSINKTFKEGGIYWLIIDETEPQCCLLLENDPINNIYMPILYLFLGLLGLAVLYTIGKIAVRKAFHRKLTKRRKSHDLSATSSQNPLELSNSQTTVVPITKNENDTAAAENEKQNLQQRKRLRSLDTFRGICLVVMIFVNYGSGGYTALGHVPWNGLALADLVFPWFVFIMGTAMAFTVRSMLKRGTKRSSILIEVFRRTILLFGIGLALNSSGASPTNFEQFRIFGVMQRLALTYFLAALPEAIFTKQSLSHSESSPGRYFSDLLDSWPQWIINLFYLAVYLGLTFGLPVPGCPTGYLGPGGLHDGGKHFNCSGGAAAYIDRLVLTNNHIYNWATFKEIYKGELSMDPEGLLGTLCAAFMCFLGVQSGRIIQCYKSHSQRIVRWTIWGIITGIIGTILCKASKNDGWIPINKNLWSLSFTLTLSAMAFFLLALLYFIIDLLNIWDGQPFYYPGMNSLIIYIGHSVFHHYLPIVWEIPADHWRHLLMDVWGTTFWVIVAFLLYRKNIFVAL